MAFIPTPGAAKVVLQGVAGAVPIVNTLWFGGGLTWNASQLNDLLDRIEVWLTNNFVNLLPTDYLLNQIVAYDMSSATGPKVERTVSYQGPLTGGVSSYQSTMPVSFITENRSRSGRGYNAISPLRESDVEDNVITGGHRDNAVIAYSALNDVIQATLPGIFHCVVSHYLNGSPRLAGLVQAVTGYEVATQFVRTLKSRREP